MGLLLFTSFPLALSFCLSLVTTERNEIKCRALHRGGSSSTLATTSTTTTGSGGSGRGGGVRGGVRKVRDTEDGLGRGTGLGTEEDGTG